MSDLAEFLLARIAEDEQIAHSAPGLQWHVAVERTGSPGHWCGIGAYIITGDAPSPFDSLSVGDEYVRSVGSKPFTVDHIARHDPARILAECEAKRRIVADIAENYLDHPSGIESPDGLAACVLQLLALPYADHPDYRQEWRP